MRNFQDIFPGLSRSWNFQEKKLRTFQDFPGGMETLSNVCSANTAVEVNHTFSYYAQYTVVPVNLHSSHELIITS